MPMRKKREDTDIDQFLYPKLTNLGIDVSKIRRNISTSKSGLLRGDIWISDSRHDDKDFEKNILTLIECKDHSTKIGDKDWQDALKQGQQKSIREGLKSFFVTNTQNFTRCYNSFNLSEISLDLNLITEIQPPLILRAIQTQVSKENSNVVYSSFSKKSLNPKKFRASLWNLRQIFRSSGISKGSEDSMIKSTLTFGILKLISEQQKLKRTLPSTILLWDDWRRGQLDREIQNTIADIIGLPEYSHLRDGLSLDKRISLEAYCKIYDELSSFSFYGSDFDFFGLIYESLASKEIKKDFGEFYTPRHIIRSIVKLLLRDEQKPRNLKICDPACGTGGFLVESFLYMQRAFEKTNTLTKNALKGLKENTFYGFDTNDVVAIPFARTNMLMADDGGVNIKVTQDSLIDLPTNHYDYILTNIPYGKYDGEADISNFSYTNAKRYELLFLEKIVCALKPGGKAAVIVPDGLIESTSNADYRKCLLHDADVNAVISLPSSVFEPYTTEKTYVLFITKKRPAESGKIQIDPIYFFIIDKDGFQDGKKKYPINEDDLPILEECYCFKGIVNKAGHVDIAEVSEETYYSLCPEYYIRRVKPIEVDIEEFKKR